MCLPPDWNRVNIYLPKLGKDKSDKIRESMFLSFILMTILIIRHFRRHGVTRVFFDRERKITRSVM